MHRSRIGIAVGVAAVVLGLGAPVQAQETLQQVKVLYASAAYEDALSMLTRLSAVTKRPELDQYRVFCLVALGRTVEAEKAIAAVVLADPSFEPDPQETSPRIQEMFARTRRAMVPEIAQAMYVRARSALGRKDHEEATAQFGALVKLIDRTPNENDEEPMLTELRLLASGFLDLSRAAAAAEARAVPAKPEPPAPTSRPAMTTPLQVTAPVPVRQELPVWVPPFSSNGREFRGTLRVIISADGRVTDAELAPAIHPTYDRLLLNAARSWEYQPALKNGAPVASEKVIEVVLKPR
jgi:tetratricopeptide (TPR) repeat protein